MHTLELALRSRVPLISVTTSDPVNAPDIIKRLVGCTVGVMTELDVGNYVTNEGELVVDDNFYNVGILYPHGEIIGTYENIYEFAQTHDFCFVLLNTEYESPLFLDIGEMPIPKEMVTERIVDADPSDPVADILAAVGGLDLKTITEMLKLTKVRDGNLTAQGIIDTRKRVVPSVTGLSQLDTNMPFYKPSTALCSWLESSAHFVKDDDVDPRLRPKGLLFNGLPGCGKTQGAKFIAESLKLPLYLLDVAGLLNRFHGESETNLIRALSRIDEESPCVVLMDEVEKLFFGTDEGTQNRLLAKLLWWLQERQSNAVVIMTCNDIDKLPKELYREGRIDKVITFEGLKSAKDCKDFISSMVQTFEGYKVPSPAMITKAVKTLTKEMPDHGIAHSRLAQTTQEMIKDLNTL